MAIKWNKHISVIVGGKKKLKNSIECDGHLYFSKTFSKLKIEMILKLKKNAINDDITYDILG